jgi:fucose permease
MKKIMLMLFMGGILSGRFAVAWLGYRLTHRQILGACVGCAFFLLPVMATTGHPVVAGAFLLLHGLAFSAAYPTHFAYVTRFFPGKRSALSGGAGLANSVGYAIGYVAAGWISEWSLSAAVLMGPALMVIYAVLFVTLNLREKRLVVS